jgi:hypothetical protein
MFDLNQEIARWKRTFAEMRTCSQGELDELESHLRDDIAALVATGIAEQDAFCQGVSRLGDPAAVCNEFAKNELHCDSLAIRAVSVMIILLGLAAVALGLAVWIERGEGLLAAHQASIIFAYVVPFLLAVLGTYAIARGTLVKSGHTQFRERFATHCKFLLAAVALGCALGTILGGVWAGHEWGHFWSWDPKETGALSVVTCAVVLFVLVAKLKPTSIHLGQASLMMSLVTFVAWFGPAVYLNDVGPLALALLAVALFVQLSILSISFFVPRTCLADS